MHDKVVREVLEVGRAAGGGGAGGTSGAGPTLSYPASLRDAMVMAPFAVRMASTGRS